MYEVQFCELCKPMPQKGYALRVPYSIIQFLNVATAVNVLCAQANSCIQLIEQCTGKRIKEFTFRKTYIRKIIPKMPNVNINFRTPRLGFIVLRNISANIPTTLMAQ